MLSAGVYIVCATFYLIFASGKRQVWDNPDKDVKENKSNLESVKATNETQQ